MQIAELQELMAQHPEVDVLKQALSKKWKQHFLLSSLYASARAMTLSAIHTELSNNQLQAMVVVMDNADDAQYMYADMKTLSGTQHVYYYPTSHRRRQQMDEAMMVQRTEVLTALIASNIHKNGTKCPIIVTTPEALSEAVPQPNTLEKQTISLAKDDTIAISELTKKLLELGFKRVDFVYEPGQFAQRGGIVDVYSFAHDIPFRIDFFGEEIDSIREFELETQLSQNKVDKIEIVANGGKNGDETTILAYLPEKTLWISNDFGLLEYKIKSSMGVLTTDFLNE